MADPPARRGRRRRRRGRGHGPLPHDPATRHLTTLFKWAGFGVQPTEKMPITLMRHRRHDGDDVSEATPSLERDWRKRATSKPPARLGGREGETRAVGLTRAGATRAQQYKIVLHLQVMYQRAHRHILWYMVLHAAAATVSVGHVQASNRTCPGPGPLPRNTTKKLKRILKIK